MSRVLVIGLDSADADLIEQWSADGTLPTLAGLRRDGLWARLRTTADLLHVSAWPTIYTGARPGQHGMYHAYQIRAGEQHVHRTRASESALPPFWKFLDEAGRQSLVMDAFMAPPLEEFQGTQILEYGTWTWFTEPLVSPRSVEREILGRFGAYPAPEHTKVFTVPDPVWFRDELVAATRKKAQVVRWLLRERQWDMAFVTFAEPHGAGHYLWHLGDAGHPAHTTVGARGAAHALRDVYAAVDTAIGEVLEEVADSVQILVISGDGMGPNYSGCHLLPEVLHRLGLFDGAMVGADSTPGPRRARGLAASLRAAIPLPLRHAVTRCLPRALHHRLAMAWVNTSVDWERSSVFLVPNANEGYLRVNLRGREPRGTVAPGSAYEDLLGELHLRLSELIVPAAGLPAARSVVRTDEAFPGPQQRHLPDLVVTWNPVARVLDELHSERCGLVRGPAGYLTAPYYTGNHRPNAFVLARGPHVLGGGRLADGHIVDVPATILALLGTEPPKHFEGRPWPECLPR